MLGTTGFESRTKRPGSPPWILTCIRSRGGGVGLHVMPAGSPGVGVGSGVGCGVGCGVGLTVGVEALPPQCAKPTITAPPSRRRRVGLGDKAAPPLSFFRLASFFQLL